MCDRPRLPGPSVHEKIVAPKIIAVRGSHAPYGWMGNMSPHPVYWAGVSFHTAEALFQRKRFPLLWDHAGEISSEKNPMRAKMIAKKYRDEMIVTPCSPEDVNNMRNVVEAKFVQNQMIDKLIFTGDVHIVEDVTNRPKGNALFWGARRVSAFEWHGTNTLGKIIMELRTKFRSLP